VGAISPKPVFTSNRENFIEDIEHSDMEMTGHNVLNEWTDADVMTVNMLGLTHPELCSMCQRWPLAEEQVADYGREDANTSYSWVALYTLQFLNAYIKHDAAAKEFLGRTTADNGVPKHIMGIRFSPKSFAETCDGTWAYGTVVVDHGGDANRPVPPPLTRRAADWRIRVLSEEADGRTADTHNISMGKMIDRPRFLSQ
jgi:hypothetical protein